MKVFKYPLVIGHNAIFTHQDAKFLRCGVQGDRLVVWALVDEYRPITSHNIEVFGTGWDFNATRAVDYIDTVTDPKGYVWHAFQIHD